MSRPRICLVAGFAVLCSCASSAPTVKSTMQSVGPSSAVVIGKFGVYSKIPRDVLFFELRARSLADGKTWKIPLSAEDKASDGNSVPFFLELPPGPYALTKWLFVTSSAQYQGENAGVFFLLEPGKVSCVGAIYMGSAGQVPDQSGSGVVFKSGTVVRDECDALAIQLKKKAPLLGNPQRTLGTDFTQAAAGQPR